ncbi:hypothetical protein Fcan01_09313 [Folsomia candida]|uniref:Uncharacterized protein n=1 Tax=Folsomia candida TaxID=158441 RepID=A0A226EDL6_FOLCA|nr:hypothetical protein Fcan01_09313 [Folsomia candida]
MIYGSVFSQCFQYFAIAQLVGILPTALSSLTSRALEALLALIFAVFFFASGFMTFRGADEESQVLIGIGGILLLVILTERFVLMYFGLLLNPTLPEGDFLNAYGFSGTVPVLFTVILYIVYLFILFVYHYELKQHVPGSGGGIGLRISGGLNVRALLEKNNGSPRHFSGIPDAPAGSNSNITNAIPKNGVQYHHGANPNLNNHHNTIISRP